MAFDHLRSWLWAIFWFYYTKIAVGIGIIFRNEVRYGLANVNAILICFLSSDSFMAGSLASVLILFGSFHLCLLSPQ